MCEPRNRDNGASDLWTLTAYYVHCFMLLSYWLGKCNCKWSETVLLQESLILQNLTGPGGHFHIDGDGDVPLDRVWFSRSSIGTGYLNRPNWLLAGYSVYHRVASRLPSRVPSPQCLWQARNLGTSDGACGTTMFMTGPRSGTSDGARGTQQIFLWMYDNTVGCPAEGPL